MSRTFDKFIPGVEGDVKSLAAEQREGIRILRKPTIELWNSLRNGRPQ